MAKPSIEILRKDIKLDGWTASETSTICWISDGIREQQNRGTKQGTLFEQRRQQTSDKVERYARSGPDPFLDYFPFLVQSCWKLEQPVHELHWTRKFEENKKTDCSKVGECRYDDPRCGATDQVWGGVWWCGAVGGGRLIRSWWLCHSKQVCCSCGKAWSILQFE